MADRLLTLSILQRRLIKSAVVGRDQYRSVGLLLTIFQALAQVVIKEISLRVRTGIEARDTQYRSGSVGSLISSSSQSGLIMMKSRVNRAKGDSPGRCPSPVSFLVETFKEASGSDCTCHTKRHLRSSLNRTSDSTTRIGHSRHGSHNSRGRALRPTPQLSSPEKPTVSPERVANSVHKGSGSLPNAFTHVEGPELCLFLNQEGKSCAPHVAQENAVLH